MPVSSIFPSRNHSSRDDLRMKVPAGRPASSTAFRSRAISLLSLFVSATVCPEIASAQDFKGLETVQVPKNAKPVALNPGSPIKDVLLDAWKSDLNAYGPTPFYYSAFPTAQGDVIFTINTSRCVNTGAADKDHLFSCKAMLIQHKASAIEVLKVFEHANSIVFSAELTPDSFKRMTPQYRTDFALDPKTLRLSYRDISGGEASTGEIRGEQQ